ncbi:MAG: acylneuraminate cytidylyltransferase family protein [Lachnospiraceae bacterium]|nr:acylneuraminate cytidylyltransferase family protein [Lachnospiraceae bacterium]
MSHLAIIPARSGSKGLKDKNIKSLGGKPLIAYSIEAALNSGIFDEVYVSTDSIKYADIAKKYGAEVPFLRSEENSGDKSSSWDAVNEALRKYGDIGMHFDNVTLLQPTSPLRTAEDIKGAYNSFVEKNATAVISVCLMEHCPLWSNTLPEDMSMKEFISREISDIRRQDLPVYYRLNGAIYMIKKDALNDIDGLYENDCYAYVMPKERSIDIDELYDFKMAEVLLKENS